MYKRINHEFNEKLSKRADELGYRTGTLSDGLRVVATVAIVVVILFIVLGGLTAALDGAKRQISRYPNTAPENIHVAPMPRDCDYDTAPLGNKLCHYEKTEGFVDRNGLMVRQEVEGGQVFVTWQRVKEQ